MQQLLWFVLSEIQVIHTPHPGSLLLLLLSEQDCVPPLGFVGLILACKMVGSLGPLNVKKIIHQVFLYMCIVFFKQINLYPIAACSK